MKNLTNTEMREVSGGIFNLLLGYFAPKAIEAVLEAASEVDDMYQDTNPSLPYNRL